MKQVLTYINSLGWTVINRLVAFLLVGIIFPMLVLVLLMLKLFISALVVLGFLSTRIPDLLNSGKKSLTTMSFP